MSGSAGVSLWGVSAVIEIQSEITSDDLTLSRAPWWCGYFGGSVDSDCWRLQSLNVDMGCCARCWFV